MSTLSKEPTGLVESGTPVFPLPNINNHHLYPAVDTSTYKSPSVSSSMKTSSLRSGMVRLPEGMMDDMLNHFKKKHNID
jgi:hypothetical protein